VGELEISVGKDREGMALKEKSPSRREKEEGNSRAKNKNQQPTREINIASLFKHRNRVKTIIFHEEGWSSKGDERK